MRVLVVGEGGREHALVWKLAQSKRISALFCAPGNGGIGALATCLPVAATDISGMIEAARANRIDYVVVAPDDPLAAGMVDALLAAGIRAFGPNQKAAQMEASKVFAKALMHKYGIPTSASEVFDDFDAAFAYVKAQNIYPAVLKADGLAKGKGVILAKDENEAREALEDMLSGKLFGHSGARVVIEEFMTGPEVSALCFTDGKTIVPMPGAQDHKRVFDHDLGPNTGGMGAFAPSPAYTKDLQDEVARTILFPTLEAMRREGIDFRGVLYVGLMLTPGGPKVVEYNARFGDPETQALLPLLDTDLLDVLEACSEGTLADTPVRWKDAAACCVVMASGGYPASYPTGIDIEGVDKAEAKGAVVFQAGTKRQGASVVTAGGRVLGVTGVAQTLDGAIEKAYEGVAEISFQGAHYRQDIGKKR